MHGDVRQLTVEYCPNECSSEGRLFRTIHQVRDLQSFRIIRPKLDQGISSESDFVQAYTAEERGAWWSFNVIRFKDSCCIWVRRGEQKNKQDDLRSTVTSRDKTVPGSPRPTEEVGFLTCFSSLPAVVGDRSIPARVTYPCILSHLLSRLTVSGQSAQCSRVSRSSLAPACIY